MGVEPFVKLFGPELGQSHIGYEGLKLLVGEAFDFACSALFFHAAILLDEKVRQFGFAGAGVISGA